MRSLWIVALCGLLGISPATAAIVQPGQGTVYVNQGGGYQPVTSPTDFPPGTVVMVSPGGNATMTYPDGCPFQIQPGQVYTVQTTSPCVGPQQQTQDTTQNTSPWLLAGLGVAAAAGVGVGIYYAISP